VVAKQSENYYDGDFEIEGAIIHTFGWMLPERLKPTAVGLDEALKEAIKKCRDMKLTDNEIEESIRLNLRTYGYKDDTFPVEKWMGV